MIRWLEYFRSVEHVWVIWVVSLVSLVYLTYRILRGFRWQDCKAILSEEDGAAYSLSYVMCLPLYLILVCLIIEGTLVLIVKMGTIYAAYAGARAEIAWRSLDPARANDKRNQAAIQALAPFASSSQLHAKGAGVSDAPGSAATRYLAACKEYSGSGTPTRYMMAKYRYAEKATRTEMRTTSSEWDADVIVTVTYEMPFHVPGVGRILGHRAPGREHISTPARS